MSTVWNTHGGSFELNVTKSFFRLGHFGHLRIFLCLQTLQTPFIMSAIVLCIVWCVFLPSEERDLCDVCPWWSWRRMGGRWERVSIARSAAPQSGQELWWRYLQCRVLDDRVHRGMCRHLQPHIYYIAILTDVILATPSHPSNSLIIEQSVLCTHLDIGYLPSLSCARFGCPQWM